MTYPLVQFVSAPEVGATVRFDFNASLGVDVESFPEHEGFSLGAPEMIGNPGEYGTSWGDRELTLTAFIEGSRSAAFAAQTTLARELWRAENWLLFQLDATSPPRWFKTYRSPAGSLQFEHVYTERDTDLWGIPVTLTAEGGIYGPREHISAVTINNDPAHATNPLHFILPTIKGDLPAPLELSLEPSAGTSWEGHEVAIMTAANTAAPAPIVWQLQGLTAGTDTTASVADATASGGTRSTVTFSTNASMVTRLSGVAPSTLPIGAYRVFLRVGRSDTTTTFAARFGRDAGGSGWVYTDEVQMTRGTSPAAGHTTYLDFGMVSIPYGSDGLPPGAARQTETIHPGIAIQMSRLSGSGAAWPDCLVLVPLRTANTVDSRSLDYSWPGFGPYVDRIAYADSQRKEMYLYNYGVGLAPFSGSSSGVYPRVVPGATNALYVVSQIMEGNPENLGGDNSDKISHSIRLLSSYHPRYLWIGE